MTMNNPELINISPDDRGEITHNNFVFNEKKIKRFYKIENHKLNFIALGMVIKEQKYILILSGSIKVSLVKINNWKKPKKYKLKLLS